MAEQIKMLFEVNTAEAHGTLCYRGVLIAPQSGEGKLGKISPAVDQQAYIFQEQLKLETLNFVGL